jgi:hypothetical protein
MQLTGKKLVKRMKYLRKKMVQVVHFILTLCVTVINIRKRGCHIGMVGGIDKN